MDKKISQLTAATTPLTGAEELAIVQSGVTKKTTIEDVKGYKVYTALLTQSGGDNPSTTFGDEGLVLGATYTITANPDNYDLTPYGAPNSNVGTSFVSTSDGATLPYTASLTLAYNSGAPVVTVLENTIGNVWWTYDGVGTYLANSSSLFTVDKSLALIGDVSDAGPNAGLGAVVFGNSNFFTISTVSNFISFDDLLLKTPIEIRVYP